MIRSFRRLDLQKFWKEGRDLPIKHPIANDLQRLLDLIDSATRPVDVAFVGLRYDEWTENGSARYGISITSHWLLSFSWSEEDAVDVDLEWVN